MRAKAWVVIERRKVGMVYILVEASRHLGTVQRYQW